MNIYQLAQEQMEVAALLASRIAEVEPPSELGGRVEDSVGAWSRA